MRRALRRLTALAVVVIVFGAGIAVGEALHDNPTPGSTITSTRTIKP
jgi:hypothetical protein